MVDIYISYKRSGIWGGHGSNPSTLLEKKDQLKLARHYLQKIPFASERGYTAFSSFMSVSSFLECIREQLPLAQQDQELLLYHLVPVLAAMAKNDKDIDIIKAFLEDVEGGCVSLP